MYCQELKLCAVQLDVQIIRWLSSMYSRLFENACDSRIDLKAASQMVLGRGGEKMTPWFRVDPSRMVRTSLHLGTLASP